MEAALVLSVTRACYLQLWIVTQPHSNPRGMWVCLRFCSHILKKEHATPPPHPSLWFLCILICPLRVSIRALSTTWK